MRASLAAARRPVAIVGLLLSSTVALGACQNTGGKFTIADAQAVAVAACSFLPTASTVANIIAAGSPQLNTATAVGNAICAAVAPKAGTSAGKPTVAGVPVEGQRVD